MKKFTLLVLLAAPLALFGQTVFVNESFDADTLGVAPTDAAQKHASLITVQAGSGVMGTDQLARLADPAGSTGALEYNVGASGQSALYASFDLFNNNPGASGSAANPIIFGIGAWDAGSGALLNSNAKRHFGLEFFTSGASQTFKLRISGTAVYTALYTMSAVQSVQLWINDHDTNSMTYTRPDNFETASLSANSVVVYINGILQGASASGYTTNSTLNVGNSTMGRVSFLSGSSVISDFSIDNVYIAEPIPEPSTYAAIAGALALGLVVARRQRKHVQAK